MGMTGGLFGLALERERQRIGPRSARALRLFLGMSVREVAARSNLSPGVVRRVECLTDVYCTVPTGREALHAMFAALGGGWCEPETHDGALQVYVVGALANAKCTIRAAIVLLGTSERTLAKRLGRKAGPVPAEFITAMRASDPLPMAYVRAAIAELEQDGGCYFIGCDRHGWSLVGCSGQGWE